MRFFLLIPCATAAFTISNRAQTFTTKHYLSENINSQVISEDLDENNEEDEGSNNEVTSFVKFIGPYPTLPLRFPSLATKSQLSRNISGISLDFVLDTAANTNTINAQVAQELQLEDVGKSLPGYGAAGSIDEATTFLLGNCTIDMPNKEIFMSNLTASSLAVASPAAAGILGISFLNCFEGGVKFNWGGGIDSDTPMVTFYREENDRITEGMKKVPIQILDKTFLPSVTININGVRFPALLDTGSPVTLLNPVAAKLAKVDTIELETDKQDEDTKGFGAFNPFKQITDSVKRAQVLAKAAQNEEVLLIAGSNGQQVELRRCKERQSISIVGSSEGDDVSFPSSFLYVGDLPGLAALGGLEGPTSPPAAILGMDVIKRLQFMVYKQNSVYF